MLDIREESDKLLASMIYGPNATHPYLTEQGFAKILRNKLEIDIFAAKREARRQFVLIELSKSENINDLKYVLARIINED